MRLDFDHYETPSDSDSEEDDDDEFVLANKNQNVNQSFFQREEYIIRPKRIAKKAQSLGQAKLEPRMVRSKNKRDGNRGGEQSEDIQDSMVLSKSRNAEIKRGAGEAKGSNPASRK